MLMTTVNEVEKEDHLSSAVEKGAFGQYLYRPLRSGPVACVASVRHPWWAVLDVEWPMACA